MFVILVYYVNQKRVAKALKTCRAYLNWVQNSVFEGEMTEANFKILKMKLEKIIDTSEDSIIIYTFRSTKYSRREIMGVEKNELTQFI